VLGVAWRGLNPPEHDVRDAIGGQPLHAVDLPASSSRAPDQLARPQHAVEGADEQADRVGALDDHSRFQIEATQGAVRARHRASPAGALSAIKRSVGFAESASFEDAPEFEFLLQAR
jgi:hypothetical protein